VAVGFIPFAVEVDVLGEVAGGHEQVVHEEPVTVPGSLLGDFGAADGTVPDERRGAVQRPGSSGEVAQRRPVLPTPVHLVLAPEPVQQAVVLDGEGDALLHVLAEPLVDGHGVAATEHEVHPTIGEVLEGGVILGDFHRIVGGDKRGRRGEGDGARLAGDVAQDRRRRADGERPVVVLTEGEDVEAGLFGVLGEPCESQETFVLGGLLTGVRIEPDLPDGEYSKFHDACPLCRGLPTAGRWAGRTCAG
jgi:hypothetical protein